MCNSFNGILKIRGKDNMKLKALTSSQRKHLKETNTRTIRDLTTNLEYQRRSGITSLECNAIAHKLKIDPYSGELMKLYEAGQAELKGVG
jgi:hypothetical protein